MPPATRTKPTMLTALAALQANLPTVRKDQTADTGKYTYTYANLASLMNALTPALAEHGLLWVSAPRRCDDGSYELHGTLTHIESGETKEGSLPLFGRTAQEIGSSLTYMRRYLLGTVTGVVTENDDDAATAQPAGRTRTEAPPPPPTPEQALANARANAWGAYQAKYPQGTKEGFVQAYEQWKAQPFADATEQDFLAFHRYLVTEDGAA